MTDTQWLLYSRYQSPLVPAEKVCEDFFAPLTFKAWKEKVASGEIMLAVTRMTDSQKAPLYVAIAHLAAFLDARMKSSERELRAMAS